jgi:hypothetical protein
MAAVPSVSVHGRVIEAGGGALRGIVQLQRHDPLLGEVSSGAAPIVDGEYTFEDLAPGRYALAVYVADHGDVGDDTGLEFELGGADHLELPPLRLGDGRRVRVHVVDADGKAVVGAIVETIDPTHTSIVGNDTHTDESGVGVVEAVHGALRVRAATSEGQASPISIIGGHDDEVTLTVGETGVVTGMLRTKGPAFVRCSGGLWHDVDQTGQYSLGCNVGDDLEIREGTGEPRRVAVDLDPDEETYVDDLSP